MTGYVYETEMCLHHGSEDGEDVERPERLTIPYDMLLSGRILSQCTRIRGRQASNQELGLVHPDTYIGMVKSYTSSKAYRTMKIGETYPTYVCDDTFVSASWAVGSLLSLVEAVCSKKVENGLALIRPPGHHAEMKETGGFCYFNSVAIATRYVQSNFPNITKVLIVDWDVHHGNGLQHIFYDDPTVLYISLHRYDNAGYYPSLPEGNYHATGGSKAQGYNINIAWNTDHMGDVEYGAAFREVILPVAQQFSPDLVLVACGLDAADGDPLGQYHVSPRMYRWMTQQLAGLADGKQVLALEGGYNPQVMGNCLENILTALLKTETSVPASDFSEDICQNARVTLDNVKTAHKMYWKF